MTHFNGLTSAELERLAILSEELGEAQQAIGKIIRHGYNSYNPDDESIGDNRSHLSKELGDVRYAMIALCDAGDLDKDLIHFYADKKKATIRKWLHHQEIDK